MSHSNNKYELLIHGVVDYALFLLDEEGRIVSWNRGAEEITGYTEEEVRGQTLRSLYAEDNEHDLTAAALSTGRVEEAMWWRRKDGRTFWANCVIDGIVDDGALKGYACVIRDLTERKLADDRLRHSEEQFRLLVQGVGDCAIYMLDTEGRVTSWNKGAERIKGYTRDEILGKHLETFYTLDDRANGVPQRGLRIAAETGHYESEGWRVRKDGTSFWAQAILDRIDDDQGRHVGFAKVTRDITQRREADQALAEAREALFQSQKLESIGQLTGGVAHDFNNLLMAIIGSLELVEPRLGDDAATRNLVANALAGARRGAALTTRMLAFARKQELLPTVIDVRALVQGISTLLQRSVGPTVVVDTVFPLSLPQVLVDGNQLELALLNLVMNARDAMEEGGNIVIAARDHLVSAGHRTALREGRYVCLSVTDDGQGMDKATLDRAMEPFFTTKGVGKGTGLGLSMVHGLAEQSGGRLLMRSEPGHGTTAEIWLPEAHVRLPEDEQESPIPLREEVASPSDRKRTILIVDDDPLIAMTMSAVLNDLGHTSLEAHSGREAIELMDDRDDVELMITDYAMPNMTGLQLTEQVRERHPGLPVVIASGFAELPAGSALGVVRLAKPFGRADLAQAIANAIEQHGHNPASHAAPAKK